LHLACHGILNQLEQPPESSMRDGRLIIKNVILSNWQNSAFAFLSACHTTVEPRLGWLDPCHLTAAIQFSGFRSVVGFMW
ncbi:uncharacterized protein F5147DRAFT_557488, partial [Suillus discolor]